MHITINQNTITLYPTIEMAEGAAKAYRDEDCDWTYTVLENASEKFVIECRDEDGEFISCM